MVKVWNPVTDVYDDYPLDPFAVDSTVVHDTGDETIAGVKTFTSDPIIPDEVYGAGWNGSLEVPTKNAVYDKIETIGGGSTLQATMYRSTNQTGLVDVTYTDVDWSTVQFDDASLADATTNQFTAPVAGRYRLESGIVGSGTGISAGIARVLHNGAEAGYASAGVEASAVRVLVSTGWKSCAASDVMKVQAYLNVSSGTGTLTGGIGFTWATFEFVAD